MFLKDIKTTELISNNTPTCSLLYIKNVSLNCNKFSSNPHKINKNRFFYKIFSDNVPSTIHKELPPRLRQEVDIDNTGQ